MADVIMPLKHIAIFVSYAPSLLNFRGPLIRELRARGIAVTTFAPDFDAPVQQELEALGISCWEVPLSRRGINPVRDLCTVKYLTKVIGKIQPDLLLTFTIKPNIWGAFAAARARVPSVACVTGLGYAFSTEAGSFMTRVVRKAGRFLYAQATRRNARVIFQNPDDRDDFIAAGCLKHVEKARLVNGSGVDMQHYARAPLPEQPIFLMISRLLGDKGVREYAKAALELVAKNPDVTCRLVGFMDEGLDAISQAEVERWMAGGLEFLGFRTDVRPEIAAASVYVLPSYREGTPRSVLEAMAMGRAVITTDAPGCRETVEHGVTGYLVPAKETEGLLARMEELASSPELRARMGAEGYALAREKYDVDVVNRQMIHHISLA